MKRMLTLILTLALLLTTSLPLQAEAAALPGCFVPSAMMMQFNIRLPEAFRTMGDPDSAGKASKYMLGKPELLDGGMRFSVGGGDVTLEARGASGEFDPSAHADILTFTIGSAVNAIDATVLKMAFLGVVADSDGDVSLNDLMAWLPEASKKGNLSLNGYTLSFQRADAAQSLILAADEAPAASAAPAVTQAPSLPRCFVPQEAAMYFNGLLGPTLEMLGAPDPGALAEQFRLTKADIVDSVLFLSSADGRVEINAYFEDGQPAVDRQANTLTLAMARDVDRSELLSLAGTFALLLSEMDSSVGDFTALLDWMADSVDGGDTAVRPMNGYALVYAKGQNGYMFTLVPDAEDGGGQSGGPAAASTPAPTAEPVRTPDPTQALPQSLPDAFMEVDGLWIQLLNYEISSTGSVWLYFRLLNTTDETMRVQVGNASVNGVPVYATTIGSIGPHSDSSTEDCLLTSYSDNKAEGDAALANPGTIGLTIVVKDDDYHELTTQPITIDTSTLSVKLAAAPVVTPKPTPKPEVTAKPYYYQSLAKGDKGEDVRRLQQRLAELGYLDDKADGQFGAKTAAAVNAFNEANGFGSGKVATIAMQEKLFSASAKAWSEPWIPVEVPRTEWRNIGSEGASYRFKFQNTSKTRTIKGIEICYYVTDVWGNRLWGSSIYRQFTTNVTIKPGKTGWSMWCYMTPSWYTIQDIHIGISKVAFSDGTIHENSSVSYDWVCTLH